MTKRSLFSIAAFIVTTFIVAVFAVLLIHRPALADTIVNSSITVDTTWTKAGSPYIVGGISVNPGVTLTIEPGVVVKFSAGGSLNTSNGAPSTLIAEGTEAEPIVFTSASGTPQPGDWLQLHVYPPDAMRLKHCVVEYTGAGASNPAIYIQSSNVSISDCTIRHSKHDAIYINGAGLTPKFERLLIETSDHAIYQSTVDMQPFYSQLRLRNNKTNAVFIPGGFTTRDITLDSTGILEGVLKLGSAYIGAGTTLTVAPGSTIQFPPGGTIDTANGILRSTLVAEGTPSQPITFTSVLTTPQPGDWLQLHVYPPDAMRLKHCVVEYAAGGNGNPALYISSSAVSISDCTIRNNANAGIFTNNAQPLLRFNRIQGNGIGLVNVTPNMVVDARVNWWGTISGPKHPTLNPAGTGNNVSDGVLFKPWLLAPLSNNSERSFTTVVNGSNLSPQVASGGLGDFVFVAQGGENIIFEARPTNPVNAPTLLLYRPATPPLNLYGEQDKVGTQTTGGVYRLLLSNVAAGNHYFTLLPQITSGTVSYEVTVRTVNYYLSSVAPTLQAAAPIRLHAEGIFGFAQQKVSLCNASNPALVEGELQSLSDSTGSLSLNLSAIAPGTYDLCITWPDNSTQKLANAITVQAGLVGKLEARIESPGAIRLNRRGTATLVYANTGTAPIASPLLIVGATGAKVSTHPSLGFSASVRILGLGEQAPLDLLLPGTVRRVPIYVEATSATETALTLQVIDGSNDGTFDWAVAEAALRPQPIPGDWATRWAAAIAPYGNTWGSVVTRMNILASMMAETPAAPRMDDLLDTWLGYTLLASQPVNQRIQTANQEESPQSTDSTSEVIKLYCPDQLQKYTYDYDAQSDVDVRGFNPATFDPDQPTYIVIHGLQQSADDMAGLVSSLSNSVSGTVNGGKPNVLLVDWEVGAKISTGLIFSITQCRSQSGHNGPELASLWAFQRLTTLFNGVSEPIDWRKFTIIADGFGADVGAVFANSKNPKIKAILVNLPKAATGKKSGARLTYDNPTSVVIVEEPWDWSDWPVTYPTPRKPTNKPRWQFEWVWVEIIIWIDQGRLNPDKPWSIFDGVIWPEDPKLVAYIWPPPLQPFLTIYPFPVLRSWDPNDKQASVETAQPGDWVRFTIRFENVRSASAPAQEVFVSDTLDQRFDWASVRFGSVGFGDTTLSLPDTVINQRVEASTLITDYRGGNHPALQVDVNATSDLQSGQLNWVFTSLDPKTGTYPADALAGFLPPNDSTKRGEGYVSFAVRIKNDVPLGAVLPNNASIIFDTNEAIVTNQATVTVGQPTTGSSEKKVYLPLVSR